MRPYANHIYPEHVTNLTIDGYDCLLVESEGGKAEELVDEENGILISTMLRQYFMALRTVGKWRKLSEHWETVASKLKSNTQEQTEDLEQSLTLSRKSTYESDIARSNSWHDFLQARLGHNKIPHDDDHEDDQALHELAAEEPEEEHNHSPPEVGADPDNEMDIEILLLRKFWARWTKKAGIKSNVCGPASDDALLVDWTRLIAPTVEGRITMVESKA